MVESSNQINIKDFLRLERSEISKIVKERGNPECACIMLDGTRRVLKLNPKYHSDRWLYYEDHIAGLIHKSMDVVDMFFDCGLNTVVGPLASLGNLNRNNFMPTGLERLLKPLTDEYSVSIFNKHNAAITFYGDLETARNMEGGEILDKYSEVFEKLNPQKPSKYIPIGIGFSTDTETNVIAKQAIEYFQNNGSIPTHEDLVLKYFGFQAPPIDIFIRTNELKPSGGLTPLLVQHDTQFYFPISPGIMSLSETSIRRILYDYMYSRVLSHGMHEHAPISGDMAEKVGDFYELNKDRILGIGTRVGDMWIHDEEN